MATSHRTKQVNLRFPLPLLSQIKAKADNQQQAIADWILAVISREFATVTESKSESVNKKSAEPTSFVLHPEILEYVQNCLAPLQTELAELRTALGESAA